MKSLRVFSALLLVPLIAPAASPAESTPPFIYYIAPISDGLNERLESLGLLPAHGGDADRKAKVLRPVACAGGPCRRLVEPPRTNDPKWYSTLLALEPTRAGRFATFLVSFDGWYLSLSVDMYDAKLAESGKFEMTPRYFTIYNSDCSRLPADENACLLRELEIRVRTHRAVLGDARRSRILESHCGETGPPGSASARARPGEGRVLQEKI